MDSQTNSMKYENTTLDGRLTYSLTNLKNPTDFNKTNKKN